MEAERLIRASKRGFRIGVVDIVQEPRTGGIARGASLSVVTAATMDMFQLWWKLTILRRIQQRAIENAMSIGGFDLPEVFADTSNSRCSQRR